jgi:hypothetical protein
VSVDTQQTASNTRRTVVTQYAVIAFGLAISFIGIFPWHLLSLFPLGAAIQFPLVDRKFRWATAAISLGLLALGLGSAVGLG